MTDRETILQSIRQSLSHGKTNPELPEVPEVWKTEGKSKDQLIGEFSKNLTTVAGEAIICTNANDAVQKIASGIGSLAREHGVAKEFEWGVKPGEPSISMAKKIEDCLRQNGVATKPVFAPEQADQANAKELATLGVGIVHAEYLLADTGSAVIRSASAFERLLCYLVPACFVIAKKSSLREHLPHAWQELGKDHGIANATSGEFLIVTGPSRTADIEKILILGVHGPRILKVFVIDNE